MKFFSMGILAGVFSLLCLGTPQAAFSQIAAADLDSGPWMNCASPDDNGIYFHSDKMKVQTEDTHEKKYSFDGHAVHIGKRDLVVDGHKLIEGNKVWISSNSSEWPGGCPEGGVLKSGTKPAAPVATPTSTPTPISASQPPAQPASVPTASAASTPAPTSGAAASGAVAQTHPTAAAGEGECAPGKGGPGPQGSFCGTLPATGASWDCRPDAAIKSCPFLKLQPVPAS